MSSSADTPASLLLVEDQEAVRIGWMTLLDQSPQFNVIATSSSGEEATELAARNSPDICLVDLRLPGLAGPALIEALLIAAPETRVVVLTSFGDPADIAACLSAGAKGYLSKDTDVKEMMEVLRLVMAGKRIFDFGDALQPLISNLLARLEADTASAALTPREVDVLRCVADGLSNSDIGDQLGIAERTVKNILSSAMRKLRAPNRTAAAMFARDEGLI